MSLYDSKGTTIQDAVISREFGMSDPLFAKHLYLERRAGEGTQTYSKLAQYSELPIKYQPSSKTKSFPLAVVSLPKTEVQVFLANPDKELLKKYIHDKTISFCVHPATLKKMNESYISDLTKLNFEAPLRAVPTSSSRTVFILDSENPAHAIKCHSPFQISRFYRNLGPLTIRQNILISEILDHMEVPHLPESIGISLPTMGNKRGWGFIVREMTPRPHPPEERLMIPCFALYGKDIYHPEEPPLLVKMIKSSKQAPKDYVLQHIMFPIIEDFISVFKTQGILLEAHGQNTLLEVDEQLNPKRIIHRDFDNSVDLDLRRRLGLTTVGFKTFSNDPPGAIHSLIYDNSIAHHHFEYLAKMLQDYFNVSKNQLQLACSAKFQDCFPDFDQYFPPKVYYYADKPISYNNYPLIGTGEVPTWRPA